MKKAVIQSGGKQYLVQEGETLDVELLHSTEKSVNFEPLLVISGDEIEVGTPILSDKKVKAEIIMQEASSPKVTAIRFKAKKRVHKIHGHRQRLTKLKIVSIA